MAELRRLLKTALPTLAGVACGLAAAGAVGLSLQPDWTGEIVELRDSLSRDTTRSDVERLLQSPRFSKLMLKRETDRRWFVDAPHTPFRRSWRIWIDFGETRIIGVRVRDVDSAGDAPRDVRSDASAALAPL
jgi:hypothetical protein